MKYEELEIEYVGYGMGFYPTEKVDAAIDELKDELNNQKWRGDEWARNANDKDKQIAELKARINELESIPHTDNSAVIDALETENAELQAENRRLKRALWLARKNNHANYKRCLAMAEMCVDLCNARWHKRWLAIAEKFKEAKG